MNTTVRQFREPIQPKPPEPPKPPTPYGAIVARIIDALTNVGPMTNIECCEYIGVDKYEVGAVFSRMRRAGPKSPKRIHIKAWVYDQPGARRYPRAVYAVGDKPDARRPKASTAKNSKRWRDSKAARVTSVFDLAIPVRQRIYRRAA